MLHRVLMLILGSAVGASAGPSVIQLTEGASVSGTILAEKPESLAVDIGFTVLMIPRTHIVQIHHADDEGELVPATALDGAGSRLFHTAAESRREGTVRDLVQQIGEAVVQVRTPRGLGSGFFLNEDGFLITNFHVIEGETQISVEVYHQREGQLERRTYREVRIVAMNKFADLALLRIEDRDAPNFAWVPLADSDSLAVGERVFAIGSPLGLERTVTEGIVSTKTRQLMGALYLQTTAQINPGNSGGPLFNLRGEVVGVTNMRIMFGEGLGFAIPVEAVRFFLHHRDAYAYDNDNPSNPYRYLEPPSRLRSARENPDPN